MRMNHAGTALMGVLAFGLVPAGQANAQAPVAAAPTAGQVAFFRNDTAHTGYQEDALPTPLSLLWRHTTEPAPSGHASPLYADGVAYFGAGKHVYALHAADGRALWQFPSADADSDTVETFSGTPTLDNGSLYMGSDSGNLYKLDMKTGQSVWSKKVEGAIRGAVTVEGGVVYFGSADTHCYAVSADTGDSLWSFATNGPVTTAPVVAGDSIYFASADDSIYCLAKATGRKAWSEEMTGDPTNSPPVYSNGTLFVGAGSTFYAFSARSGVTRWSQELPAEITTWPTVGPGFVAVGTVEGGIYAFNPQGRLKWRKVMKYPVVGVPLLAGGVFLVPSERGVLYALQADTGKTLWNYHVPASVAKQQARDQYTQVTSAPIYVDGTLFVLSNDGSLSALRPDTLSVLPPQVTALTPLPASTISTAVYPSATLQDEGSGIDPASVSLLLDGRPLPHVIYDPTTGEVTVDTSAADSKPTLTDDTHQVVVKATDWRGNAVSQTWGFVMDSKAAPPPTTTDSNGNPINGTTATPTQ